MSGIVGVWNLDGRPLDRALVERLARPLAHRGPDGLGIWQEGPVALACQNFRLTPESKDETLPLIGRQVVLFDGRLDNRPQLLSRLPVRGECGDAKLIAAAYEKWGNDLPRSLTGDFALALYDPHQGRLLLARDALGVRPLYYALFGRTFLFASEIKALQAHPESKVEPDDELLAEFLLERRYDQERTFFKGILSLPPAHALQVGPKGVHKVRYWDFSAVAQTRMRSFGEYAEAFRALFEGAVRRRMRSLHPVAVSVSGGLDSSSIFCVGRRSGESPIGISYLSPDGTPSDEKSYLVDIESKYGARIHRVPTGRMGFLDGSSEAVRHVEAPMVDEQWSNTRRLLSATRALGARVLLTGHWADQLLFPQGYLVDLLRRFRWGRALAHLREFGAWMTDADPRCFRRRFLIDIVKYHLPSPLFPLARRLRQGHNPPWFLEAYARNRCRPRRGPPLGGKFRCAHGRSLYEQIRTGYHVLCLEWHNKVAAMHGLEVAFPFLDRDLLSFLMAIPGDVVNYRGVPKGILREAFRGILPDSIADRRWKADFTRLVNDGMANDYPALVRCIEGGLAVKKGYLRPDILKEKLLASRSRLGGDTGEMAWSLGDLVGLELWLRECFGGDE